MDLGVLDLPSSRGGMSRPTTAASTVASVEAADGGLELLLPLASAYGARVSTDSTISSFSIPADLPIERPKRPSSIDQAAGYSSRPRSRFEPAPREPTIAAAAVADGAVGGRRRASLSSDTTSQSRAIIDLGAAAGRAGATADLQLIKADSDEYPGRKPADDDDLKLLPDQQQAAQQAVRGGDWDVKSTWFSTTAPRGWAKQLRTSYCFRRRAIYFMAAWACGLSILVWILAIPSPCPLEIAADPKLCDHWLAKVIAYMESANFSVSFLVLIGLYIHKYRAISRMEAGGSVRGELPHDRSENAGSAAASNTAAAARGTRSLPASHWTGGASLDVYAGAVQCVEDMQRVILPFVFFMMVFNGLVKTVLTIAGFPAIPFSNEEIEAVCAESVTPTWCAIAWKGDVILIEMNAMSVVYMVVLVLLTPELIWGPVTARAIEIRANTHIGRLRKLPRLMLVPLILLVTVIAKYASGIDKTIATEMFVFSVNCVTFVYAVVTFAWLYGLFAFRTRRSKTAPQPPGPVGGDPPEKDLAPHAPVPGLRTRAALAVSRIFLSREAGVRSQSEIFSVVVVALHTAREHLYEVTVGPVIASVLVWWVLRVFALIMLSRLGDEEATFDTLEASGAAFGLVVDANDLFKAVSCVLKHKRPWGGRIRLYKASLLRMQETMAISYRWQDDLVPLNQEGKAINMSLWQLQALLDGLTQSTCRYVWLDKMSVIQTAGPLQRTLLARMLAVYATSACTLVLRSLQDPGGRYHQRGWTVQEFCAANKMAVATQPTVDAGLPVVTVPTIRIPWENPIMGSSHAVVDGEEDYFTELRNWHLDRTVLCRPFWIYRDIFVDVNEALLKFEDIKVRVNTFYEADKIRALMPLLMNTAVETQEELVDMILRVQAISGKSMQRELQMLASSN